MKLEKLEQGHYYHIYNRGINSTNIFNSEENKRYFLQLAAKHFDSKLVVIAYCLMDNHYHIIIKVIADSKTASQAFSNLFNAYAKAFNKMYKRTGSLFEKNFKRKKIETESYLKELIIYVHRNPETHGIISKFYLFKFSSYLNYLSDVNNELLTNKQRVISLFDDIDNFKFAHNKTS